MFDNYTIDLTEYDNNLCKAVCDLIINDNDLYILSGEAIEKILLKKVKTGKFDEFRATVHYRKMIKQHQDYIIQQFNNCPVKTLIFDKIHDITFYPAFRSQLRCLLVNAFAVKNNVEFW